MYSLHFFFFFANYAEICQLLVNSKRLKICSTRFSARVWAQCLFLGLYSTVISQVCWPLLLHLRRHQRQQPLLPRGHSQLCGGRFRDIDAKGGGIWGLEGESFGGHNRFALNLYSLIERLYCFNFPCFSLKISLALGILSMVTVYFKKSIRPGDAPLWCVWGGTDIGCGCEAREKVA